MRQGTQQCAASSFSNFKATKKSFTSIRSYQYDFNFPTALKINILVNVQNVSKYEEVGHSS
jgi:hypothetical protein